MKSTLKCLTSWCGHEWTVDYNICVFESKNGELTVKRPVKRKKGNAEDPIYYTVKCPLCNNKLLRTKDYDRNFRSVKRCTEAVCSKN